MYDFEAIFTRYENGTRYISAPLRLRAESFDAAFADANIFLSGMRYGRLANIELMELRHTGIQPSNCVVSVDTFDIWRDPRIEPPQNEV